MLSTAPLLLRSAPAAALTTVNWNEAVAEAPGKPVGTAVHVWPPSVDRAMYPPFPTIDPTLGLTNWTSQMTLPVGCGTNDQSAPPLPRGPAVLRLREKAE